MKSPLVYLTLTKFKNQVKSIFKSPSKLIYGVFLIAVFVLVAFTKNETVGTEPRALSELVAILSLFIPLCS